VLKHLLDLRASDTHGMKVIRREQLLGVIGETVMRDSLFDVEYVLRAQRAGIRIEELPATSSSYDLPARQSCGGLSGQRTTSCGCAGCWASARAIGAG